MKVMTRHKPYYYVEDDPDGGLWVGCPECHWTNYIEGQMAVIENNEPAKHFCCKCGEPLYHPTGD